jgi:hypothetical protein
MWEVGLLPSPVEFSSHRHFHKLSCPCLLGGAAAPASCPVCLQLTWEVGLPSSPAEFSSLRHSHKLPSSWLLDVHLCSRQRLSGPPGLFIYSLFTVPGRVPFPQSSVLRVPHPLSSVSLLLLLLITQFLFFPWVEVGLSRGHAALAQACLWKYRGTVKLTWSASSQAVWAPATGGQGSSLFLRLP